jgi:iron complex transport system permease protein
MVTHTKTFSENKTRMLGSRYMLFPGLLVLGGLLVVCLLWSILYGAADINTQTVLDAIRNINNMDNLELDRATRFQYLVIQTVRFPRVLVGLTVGAALAVAGAIMQGLTRNPLADSGILGINAGASFVVVVGVSLNIDPPLSTYATFAFVGAGVSAGLVYLLGSMGRGGATPLRLTLAGVILTAFISSFTSAILIGDQETLDRIRFWTAGSLAGRDMNLLLQILPYIVIGLVGAMAISRQITTISLGDDVAKGLGQNTIIVKAIAALLVVLLAGGAVALAGPIGFVGLVVPHIVRFIVGVDYRWVLPYSALLGGILVTIADVGARMVIRPEEVPVGVMMAIVGAPFFIWLARWKVKR